MRLSALDAEGRRYRVYDYKTGEFRNDLCWIDDVLRQVGVGYADTLLDAEFVFRVEQRRSVLIIPGVHWVALDLPEEKEFNLSRVDIPVLGDKSLEYVVVR